MAKKAGASNIGKSPTLREHLARTRPVFDGLRRLSALDVPLLRTALADDLRPILWEETDRANFVRFFQQVPLPSEDGFWLAVQATDEADRKPPVNGPLAPYPAERADAEYLAWCNRQQYRSRPMPESWQLPAERLLLGLQDLRRDAWMDLTGTVKTYRAAWEAGDTKALVALVRVDGVREPWVQEAIAQLRNQRVSGTGREKEQAKKILKAVGVAISSTGKGRTVELTPQQRRARKREDNRVTKVTSATRNRFPGALPFSDGGVVEPATLERVCNAAIAETRARSRRDPATLDRSARRLRAAVRAKRARPK